MSFTTTDYTPEMLSDKHTNFIYSVLRRALNDRDHWVKQGDDYMVELFIPVIDNCVRELASRLK